MLLQSSIGGQMAMGRGRVAAAAMERACAACPLALQTAANFALELLAIDSARAYATALRALQRADAAGHDFQAARLLQAAAMAVSSGAMGSTYRLSAYRPLIERARRLLDASRHYMPLTLWRQVDASVRECEEDAAALAAKHGDDASLLVGGGAGICVAERPENRRTCSNCALNLREAHRCGRCRAVW